MLGVMMTDARPSAALLEAQARLEALRASLGIVPHDPVPVAAEAVPAKPKHTSFQGGQTLLLKRRQVEAWAQRERVSDALKASLEQTHTRLQPLPSRLEPALPKQPESLGKVKVYPDISLKMVEAGMAAPGRIYWLLRYLDTDGQGWLLVDSVRDHLTRRGSKLKVCGWRRLRQILTQGENAFWRRDRVGRLWLLGAAQVAAKLAVSRLTGKPVEMPVKELLGGIQAVRAHFYACFHSGRTTDNPISREKLRALTGIPERTQLEYEKTAVVTKQRNFVIGETYTQPQTHERAWLHGRATFYFIDAKGHQGKAGREYIAWHLPNSYTGPHAKRCKGRQKKINRRLVDLVMKGMRGNGREQVDKVFWPHGAAAAAAYTRNQAHDAYWPQQPTRVRRFYMWQVLSREV